MVSSSDLPVIVESKDYEYVDLASQQFSQDLPPGSLDFQRNSQLSQNDEIITDALLSLESSQKTPTNEMMAARNAALSQDSTVSTAVRAWYGRSLKAEADAATQEETHRTKVLDTVPGVKLAVKELSDDSDTANAISILANSPLKRHPDPPPERLKRGPQKGTRRKKKRFPMRIYELISDDRNSEMITWSPDGLKLIVRQIENLASVMGLRIDSLNSDFRKFGFKRCAGDYADIAGIPGDVWYHPDFTVDDPSAAEKIVRKTTSKRRLSYDEVEDSSVPEKKKLLGSKALELVTVDQNSTSTQKLDTWKDIWNGFNTTERIEALASVGLTASNINNL